MAYILKNTFGEIIAASAAENPGTGWTFTEDNAKEYMDFLERSLSKSDPFRESDIHLVRVLEDLISLLIERNIIRFTDLPEAAQKRLNDRQTMRHKATLPTILDDNSNIF